eukprot:2195117-Rhodomonas_salina.1
MRSFLFTPRSPAHSRTAGAAGAGRRVPKQHLAPCYYKSGSQRTARSEPSIARQRSAVATASRGSGVAIAQQDQLEAAHSKDQKQETHSQRSGGYQQG